MKMKKGFKALIVTFFFFSFISSVYLFKPLGLNRVSVPIFMEQIKLEHSSENGSDVKALKALINFAKRHLPIS